MGQKIRVVTGVVGSVACILLTDMSPAFAKSGNTDEKIAGAYGCGSSYIVTMTDSASPRAGGTAYGREHDSYKSGYKTARFRGSNGYWTSYHTQTVDSRHWLAVDGVITPGSPSSTCA